MTTDSHAIRRAGFLAGLGFAVCFAAGIVIASPGDLPTPTASPSVVVHYYSAHHVALRLSAVVLGFSLLSLIVFAAALSLAWYRRDQGLALPAAALFASSIDFAATLGAGVVALPPAITLHVDQGDPHAVQHLHDIAVSLVALSGFFGAGLAGAMAAVCWSRAHRLPWLAVFSTALVVLQLAAPAGLIDVTGPTNPYNGVITEIGAVALWAWVLAASVSHLRRSLA